MSKWWAFNNVCCSFGVVCGLTWILHSGGDHTDLKTEGKATYNSEWHVSNASGSYVHMEGQVLSAVQLHFIPPTNQNIHDTKAGVLLPISLNYLEDMMQMLLFQMTDKNIIQYLNQKTALAHFHSYQWLYSNISSFMTGSHNLWKHLYNECMFLWFVSNCRPIVSIMFIRAFIF